MTHKHQIFCLIKSPIAYLRLQAEVERAQRPHSTNVGCMGVSHQKHVVMALHATTCYGIGESLPRTTRGGERAGRSHGDDTDSDGPSVAGAQPYIGEKPRVSPGWSWFPLSAGWNLERHSRWKPRGGIPPRSLRRGGQFSVSCINRFRSYK